MKKYEKILYEIVNKNISNIYSLVEQLSDEIEIIHFIDHYEGLQNNPTYFEDEIHFDLIHDETFDAARYYQLLYRYKNAINMVFKNDSYIVADLTDIDIESLREVIGADINISKYGGKYINKYKTSPVIERILDLGFADRAKIIIVNKEYKSVLCINGFTCTLYLFDSTKTNILKNVVMDLGLYLWSKNNS